MKQVAFERNAKKLAVKKTCVVNPRIVEDNTETLYQKEYNRRLEEYRKEHGEYPKGMYFRWFDEEMAMIHQAIKNGTYKRKQNKAKDFLNER